MTPADRNRWMAEAACRTLSVDHWFSETPGTSYAEAKQVCAGCAVRRECLDYALTREDYGVWGGLTPRERRRHLRGLPVDGRRRAASRP